MALIGHPILGDNKYPGGLELPFEGLEPKLHLHARQLELLHPFEGGRIDVTAPLPAHMRKSFDLLGLDPERYEKP